MQKIVGVKFNKNPKVYYFDAGESEYARGSGVIVDTERGAEYGTVVVPDAGESKAGKKGSLRPVLRAATREDEEQLALRQRRRDEAMRIASEKIRESGLEMKPVDAEYTFDNSKLIIYFTAESRVDFRDLVKELASAFRTRIELRQIGARDECRMLGGLAPCGRACCCSDHMSEYSPVSIKMAKNQNLSLNPAKISGMCGRLMCCLAYENAHYAETNKRMPKMGAEAFAPDKRKGTVVGINQLKETVRLRFEDDAREKVEFADFPLAEISFKGKPEGGGTASFRDKDDDGGDDEK